MGVLKTNLLPFTSYLYRMSWQNIWKSVNLFILQEFLLLRMLYFDTSKKFYNHRRHSGVLQENSTSIAGTLGHIKKNLQPSLALGDIPKKFFNHRRL